MKALMYGGAVALALMVTGCGDKGGDNVAAADLNAPVAHDRGAQWRRLGRNRVRDVGGRLSRSAIPTRR